MVLLGFLVRGPLDYRALTALGQSSCLPPLILLSFLSCPLEDFWENFLPTGLIYIFSGPGEGYAFGRNRAPVCHSIVRPCGFTDHSISFPKPVHIPQRGPSLPSFCVYCQILELVATQGHPHLQQMRSIYLPSAAAQNLTMLAPVPGFGGLYTPFPKPIVCYPPHCLACFQHARQGLLH